MSFTYDLSTNLGKVRNLIGDVDSANVLMQDAEISAMLSLYSQDIFMSAAVSLRRIAANKALLGKRITAGDYSEDTTGVYKGFLEAATILEQMARDVPADAQVELIYTDFNYNNILRNKILRNESIDE